MRQTLMVNSLRSDAPPLIAVTPWRRTLETWIHPQHDLYTIDPEYLDAITAAGGVPALLPWIEGDDDDSRLARARIVLQPFAALMLTGGDDVDPDCYGHEPDGARDWDRRADDSDIALLRAALEQGKPILAICRGLQVATAALGGTLLQHIHGTSAWHGLPNDTGDRVADAEELLSRRHRVDLEEGSTVSHIFDGAGHVTTNSLHHQAAADEDGLMLKVVGRAPDGMIEAMEWADKNLVAVQWHPERITDEGHHLLFEWLVGMARQQTIGGT